MLKPGTRLTTNTGASIEVHEVLGEGGQGVVYRVSSDGADSLALKWYHPPRADHEFMVAVHAEQRQALPGLIKQGAPAKAFLWPLDIVDSPSGKTFGYLMTLREDRFASFEELVMDCVSPRPSFSTLVNTARNLCTAFFELHQAGLCYKDVNLGGPFFDPITGDVLICDNDNVRVNKTGVTVLMPHFAAPELLRGEAPCQVTTDLHSLAVLLFYLFVRHHPLEGAAVTRKNLFSEQAQRTLYADNPVFCLDPNDSSNELEAGFHDVARAAWDLYPRFLQQAFTDTFTTGLKDPQARMRPRPWAELFSTLHDSMLYCAQCATENFYDRDGVRAGVAATCWSCRQPLERPYRIKLGDKVVFLNHDTVLYPHHLGDNLNFDAPVAQVNQHPKDPSRWGLENLTASPWSYSKNDVLKSVEPGRSVPMAPGREINFGSVAGAIRYG